MRRIKVPVARPTTTPGYRNSNGQEVLAATGWESATFPGQRVYRMRCTHCGHTYGSNGCDVWSRRCPHHDGGAAGEPLREPGPALF